MISLPKLGLWMVLYAFTLLGLAIRFEWPSYAFFLLYFVPATMFGWLEHTGRIKVD